MVTELDFSSYVLVKINLSELVNLEYLYLNKNQLTKIDLNELNNI